MGRVRAVVKHWAITLFIAWACAMLTSVAVSTFASGTVGSIAGGVVGLAVIVVRGFMPRARAHLGDVFTDSEIFLYDHPVVFVGSYAAISLIVSLSLPHTVMTVVIGLATWGGLGYWNLRRWRRNVEAVRAGR